MQQKNDWINYGKFIQCDNYIVTKKFSNMT